MTEELEILKLVCNRLKKAKIPYMLTGSFAANFYAVPRMTRDIDIVIEILKPDADNFFQIFQKDFYINMGAISQALEHQGMFNIIHNNSVFKIDFIIRKESSYRSIEFERRRQVQLDDMQIWIVSPEDLIISKLHWARDSLSTMQLSDVKNLLLTTQNLDRGYIYEWVQNLGLNEIYRKVELDE